MKFFKKAHERLISWGSLGQKEMSLQEEIDIYRSRVSGDGYEPKVKFFAKAVMILYVLFIFAIVILIPVGLYMLFS